MELIICARERVYFSSEAAKCAKRMWFFFANFAASREIFFALMKSWVVRLRGP